MSDIAAAVAPQVSARRERTRERLLDAAFELFSRQGIHGASIEAVCEAAGFTRGAFYSNFAAKEELFLALMERHVRERLSRLEGAAAELGGEVVEDARVRPEALRALLDAVMPRSTEERRWYLIMAEFELLALREPEVASRYVALRERITGELAAALSRAMGPLGLRFTVPEREAVELLETTYVTAARQAFLTETDDDAAADTARSSAALGRLVELLVTEA